AEFDVIQSLRLVEGTWIERLTLPDPETEVVEGELQLTWTGLPEGTTVTVTDVATSVELGSEDEIEGMIFVELIEPASYLIRLDPPASHMPKEWSVTHAGE